MKSAQLHNTHRVQGEVSFSCTRIFGAEQRSRLVPGMRAARHRYRGSIAGGCQPSVFSKAFTPALAPIHLHIQRVPLALSPGAKRTGHEANHSCPYSAEFKNEWSSTFTLKYTCNVCTETTWPLPSWQDFDLLAKWHSCVRCKRREWLSYSASGGKGGQATTDLQWVLLPHTVQRMTSEAECPHLPENWRTASVLLGDWKRCSRCVEVIRF